VPRAPVVLGRTFGSPARVGNVSSSRSAMWCCDLGARISGSLEIGVNERRLDLRCAEVLRVAEKKKKKKK
jgi:hypothetical protein